MDGYYINPNSSDILHYGVPHGKGPTGRGSGRYPWGSGIGGYIRRRMKAKKKAAALKKARETRQRNIEHEKNKERVLREGSAKEVLEYKNELTAQEINDVLNRINAKTRLEDVARKDVDAGFNKIDDVMSKIGKVNNWMSTALQVYNNVEQIKNNVQQPIKNKEKKEKEQKQKDYINSIIRSGDPKHVMEKRKDLTADELQKAVTYIREYEKLQKQLNPDKNKNKKK